MASFPSISILYQTVDETDIYDTIRSPYEAGYTHTRPRFTRSRKQFTIHWTSLADVDYRTLQTFFQNTSKGGGASFTFTDPASSGATSYTMVFADDKLNFKSTQKDYWSGSITLLQV